MQQEGQKLEQPKPSLVGEVLNQLKSRVDEAKGFVNEVAGDKYLQAAGRQGVDELGQALKAFPDAIQATEMGTIWNPTPGQIDRGSDKESQSQGQSPVKETGQAQSPVGQALGAGNNPNAQGSPAQQMTEGMGRRHI